MGFYTDWTDFEFLTLAYTPQALGLQSFVT